MDRDIPSSRDYPLAGGVAMSSQGMSRRSIGFTVLGNSLRIRVTNASIEPVCGKVLRVTRRTRRSALPILISRSTTVACRLSESNPANGIVTWHTEGFNQNEARVIDFERSNLVRRRNPSGKAA